MTIQTTASPIEDGKVLRYRQLLAQKSASKAASGDDAMTTHPREVASNSKVAATPPYARSTAANKKKASSAPGPTPGRRGLRNPMSTPSSCSNKSATAGLNGSSSASESRTAYGGGNSKNSTGVKPREVRMNLTGEMNGEKAKKRPSVGYNKERRKDSGDSNNTDGEESSVEKGGAMTNDDGAAVTKENKHPNQGGGGKHAAMKQIMKKRRGERQQQSKTSSSAAEEKPHNRNDGAGVDGHGGESNSRRGDVGKFANLSDVANVRLSRTPRGRVSCSNNNALTPSTYRVDSPALPSSKKSSFCGDETVTIDERDLSVWAVMRNHRLDDTALFDDNGCVAASSVQGSMAGSVSDGSLAAIGSVAPDTDRGRSHGERQWQPREGGEAPTTPLAAFEPTQEGAYQEQDHLDSSGLLSYLASVEETEVAGQVEKGRLARLLRPTAGRGATAAQGFRGDADEASLNLKQSAEKVTKIESFMMGGIASLSSGKDVGKVDGASFDAIASGTILSPVKTVEEKKDDEGDDPSHPPPREEEWEFPSDSAAVRGATPSPDAIPTSLTMALPGSRRKIRFTPQTLERKMASLGAKNQYMEGGADALNESQLGEAANELNESVIVSEDEEERGGAGYAAEESASLGQESEFSGSPASLADISMIPDRSSDRHIEILGNIPESGHFMPCSLAENEPLTPFTVGAGSAATSGSFAKAKSTTLSLIERNKSLVKEVRFADQTCVELSEKNRYYKDEMGRYKRDLDKSSAEYVTLRSNHEASSHETTRLQVSIESLTAQLEDKNRQSEAQGEMYRSQIDNSEKHIECLNERFGQILTANSSLATKLDEFHDKWDSQPKQDNAATKELVSSLKDRIAAGDVAMSKSEETIRVMQVRIDDMRNLSDRQQEQIMRERNEREMVEHDCEDLQIRCKDLEHRLRDTERGNSERQRKEECDLDELRIRCGELEKELEEGTKYHHRRAGISAASVAGEEPTLDERHRQFVVGANFATPGRETSRCNESSATTTLRTPTSTVLARTLRSELKHGRVAGEKIVKAECVIIELDNELNQVKMDLEESKARGVILEEELEGKSRQVGLLHEQIESMSTDDRHSEDASFETTKVELREDVTDLNERLEVTKTALEVTEGELQSAKKILVDFEESKCALSATIEFQFKSLNETRERLARSEQSNHKLRQERSTCQESIDAFQTLFQNSEREYEVAESKISEYNSRIEKMSGTIQYLQEVNDFQSRSGNEMSTFDLSRTNRLPKIPHDAYSNASQGYNSYQDVSDEVPNATLTDDSLLGVSMMEKMEEARSEKDLSGFDCSYFNEDVESESPKVPTSPPTKTHTDDHNVETPFNTPWSAGICLNTPRSAEMYYQQKISQLREEVKATDKDLATAKKEKDSALEMLLHAENELQEVSSLLSQQTSDLRNQIRRCEQDKSDLVSANSSKRNQFFRELEEMKESLSVANRELDECKEQNEELLSTVDSAVKASEVVPALKDHITELNDEVVNLRMEVESHELKLQSKQTVLRVTEDQAESLRTELDSIKTAFECMKQESDSSKLLSQRWNAEVARLQPLVTQKDNALKESQADASNAKKMYAAENRMLISIEKKFSLLESRYHNEKKESDDTARNLEDKLSVLKQQHSDTRAQLDDTSLHIRNVQDQLLSKEEECRAKQNQCQNLSSQNEELKSELSYFQKSVTNVNDKLANMTGTINSNINTINKLEESIRVANNDLSQKEELLVDSENEIQDLNQELEHCEDDISKLRNELQQSGENLRAFASEKEKRIGMLEKACKERQELFDDKVLSLKREREHILSDLEKLRDGLNASNSAHEEECQKEKLIITDLKQSLENSEAKCSRCVSSIVVLEAEVLRQNEGQNDLENEIIETRDKTKEFQSKWKAEMKKCQTMEKHLEATRKELSTASNNLLLLEENRNALKQELESSLMDVERLKTKHQDNEYLMNQKNAGLESKIASGKDELSRILAAREEGHSNGSSELAAQNDRLNKKCVTLREYVKELTSKCSIWKKECTNQAGELERTQEEVARLTSQLRTNEKKLASIRHVSHSS